jgi:hypothetical protein
MAVDDRADTDLEPQDAFALVAHELRFDILQALWNAGDEPLSFSELRAAVGRPDGGNFNYHLDRLLGPFVTRHEGSDGDGTSPGYGLTVAARNVMGAIESGGYHRTARLDPVGVEGTCPACGGGMEAVYEGNLARVRCLDCDAQMLTLPLPAGAVAAYDPADLPDLLDRWVRKTTRSVRANICPVCSGRLDGRLIDVDGPDRPAEHGMASYTCRGCDQALVAPLPSLLVEHPALVQFAMNCGVDPRDWQVWSGAWRRGIDVERLQTDPLRVAVRVTVDGETLELVVDEHLAVVDTRRPDA